MDPKLDLSLPEAPRPRRPRFLAWVNLLGILACLALLLSLKTGGRPAAPAGTASAEAERIRKLAEDLERRTLYDQAAQVWAEYLEAAPAEGEERARTVYRRGRCLKESGRHAEAARCLIEALAIGLPGEVKRNAQRFLLDCFSALGKEDVRQSVLRTFAMPGAREQGTTVARVGGDPVTREDVREHLERQNRRLLQAQGLAATPEELAERARRMTDGQLRDPQVAREVLEGLIVVEVLYREALSRGLASGREYERALERMRREYLAREVTEREAQAAAAAITETDLRNHYEAHREDYVLKPAVEFSYRRFESEEEAAKVLAALAAGGEEAEKARAELVAAKGPAVQGEPLPDLGRSPEATAHLLALEEGAVGSRAVAVGDGWYLFRADRKRPKRERSFEEAEKDVRRDLALLKEKEALERLQKSLAQKFQVEMIGENLEEKPEAQEESREAKEPGGEPAAAAPGGSSGDAPGTPAPGGTGAGAGETR